MVLNKHLVQQVKYLNNTRVLPFEILMLFIILTQWEGLGVGLLRSLYKDIFYKQIGFRIPALSASG